LFIFLVVFLNIIPAIFFLPIAIILRLLDWLTDGRALGGLGFLLAALGVLCELYQVAEICVKRGCYGLTAFDVS
jgi:hypothetical protein